MGTNSKLEVITDLEGSVRIGWVGNGVMYAALSGGMSTGLGARYAARIGSLVVSEPSVRYFADARALSYYDMLARNAFVRVILANRNRFAAITLLTWAEGIGPAARTMAATIGGAVNLLVDPNAFEAALYAAAPQAKLLLTDKAAREATPLRPR